MIYQVSYELRNSDRDYSDFFMFLERKLGEEGIRVLRDVWWVAVRHPQDVDALIDRILKKKYLETNDLFYISELSSEAVNGWMPESAWNWYNLHK